MNWGPFLVGLFLLALSFATYHWRAEYCKWFVRLQRAAHLSPSARKSVATVWSQIVGLAVLGLAFIATSVLV